ncbi:hypothetical protein BJX76DRAFT_354971 [Aspergillus varians]
MAAWIQRSHQNHSDLKRHRLLISQDRHQIRITIAGYGDGYFQYLPADHANQ